MRISRAVPLSERQAPELFAIVAGLSAKAGIPMPKIYLMEDNAMNAFATGRNQKHSAVAVTRGLLQKMTPDEVEAVVAHELAHIRGYDMRTMAIVAVLVSFISILADLYWSSAVAGARVGEGTAPAPLALIGIVLSVFAPLSAFFIQMAISRRREFVADAGSAELTGKPQALVSAPQEDLHGHPPTRAPLPFHHTPLFLFSRHRHLARQAVPPPIRPSPTASACWKAINHS